MVRESDSSADAPHVLTSEPSGGVVTLTLNRPRRKNALSIALRDQLSDEMSKLSERGDIRVVVIAAIGDVFSAGFDMKEFARLGDREGADRLWASSDRFHRTLLEFPLPTVASVNGPALAGGFDLALMCDLRVASDTASFAHPEAAFATVLYSLLHDVLGGGLARELALTGRTMGADEALRRGLVSQVVPQTELETATAELAGQIASRPVHVLRSDKQKIIRRSRHVVRGTLDL